MVSILVKCSMISEYQLYRRCRDDDVPGSIAARNRLAEITNAPYVTGVISLKDLDSRGPLVGSLEGFVDTFDGRSSVSTSIYYFEHSVSLSSVQLHEYGPMTLLVFTSTFTRSESQ
jgi:hypothetical protein